MGMHTGAAAAVITLAAAAVPAVAPDMEPGRWEIVVEISATTANPDREQNRDTRCYSAEDLAALPRSLAGSDAARGRDGCETHQFDLDARSATWNLVCTRPQPLATSGELRFQGRSLIGQMRVTMQDASGRRSDLRTRITGRWLGPC